MAKPRKPKNEDAKPENSGPVVRHQKLCLSIDVDKRRIYGYTELKIVVPEIGIVGLHAENLGIESVSVDGEQTEFEYYPQSNHKDAESERRWSWVTSPSSAADAAGSTYISALERELVPNLLINCCKAFKAGSEPQEQLLGDNEVQQSSGEAKQNVRLVRVDYWVEKAETGIYFHDAILHTDNQIRRARCWFPCIDDNSQSCCYDLEFTVAQNLVAVSTGNLLYQVLSKDDPPRKTYVYRLDVPVSARWISLVVAPFEILPDQQFGLISHMCLPINLSKLRNTVEFFHSAFSCYKDYLAIEFPFGSYKQVFIEPEMAVSSLSSGASMSVFSSQVLFDEKIIDQTIDTRIKIAFALARQWFGVYITPEAPNDEWLLDGLAGFLTDFFIKKHLGNNEARYRRYKANCAVCKADDSGATALSSAASCKDLYGTQCIGIYSKIRSWKSVAILQMLEKQMGPESFRKILQAIVNRAPDKIRSLRSLSTKEFRHFANKVGNLERPFLKEFFPRWVELCGCPLLRMGFSYNKRKNMVELAVLRGCTGGSDSIAPAVNANPEPEKRDIDNGWPGMMSIRAHELDGTFDHPVLPMAGETWQLLEIQCHSKLAARRFQKPKKSSKLDGADDNGDATPALDMRSSMESPLLWMRADPEIEYLAEIHFNQPVQMWINQLEKDKDVVAQAQAIATLESLPQLSFSVVNALNNFLIDSKAFWRVRIEAAFALANTASEDTDWAGLLHLVKFYKSRRFDANIGLPKPNDFHDISEYFVLEAIPHAIAMVRAADKKSPREAVEFVLQLLKYNDNNGNPYSDVFWLAALIESVGELEFGQQSILLLSSLLKRIDRLLQFDRLMPSYNGILSVSCIRALTQIALKLLGFVPMDRVFELVKPFRDIKAVWQVRVEASRALLDLEFHCKGIDAALQLFIKYLDEETSFRGQVKLAVHAMRLCQIRGGSDLTDNIRSETLVALLRLLEGQMAFNNIFLRHHLFCILQILAGRPPTLYGVPRDHKPFRLGDAESFQEQKNIFAAFIPESKYVEPPSEAPNLSHDDLTAPETSRDVFAAPEIFTDAFSIPDPETSRDGFALPAASKDDLGAPGPTTDGFGAPEPPGGGLGDPEPSGGSLVAKEPSIGGVGAPEPPIGSFDGLTVSEPIKDSLAVLEPFKDADTVSNSHKRKLTVKIRVKSSATTSRAEGDNQTVERSQGGHLETDRGASSSVSVDAPHKNFAEVSLSNQNLEEVNSWHDLGSRMTASIGSAKLASDVDDIGKELQCTADSSKVSALPRPEDPSPSFIQDNRDAEVQKYASLQELSVPRNDINGGSSGMADSLPRGKEKEKKKDKEKKRKRDGHKGHRDNPEYLERKRLKKEKKQKEKEIAKLLNESAKVPSTELPSKTGVLGVKSATVQLKPVEPSGSNKLAITGVETARPAPSEGATSATPKFRIKTKIRTLNNP
ncbi:transcription initiation factor TFIID subunit 2 [Pyrus ussuriensis x Pyrus communis]|uniref:Transcription initiation factor TFIID subunit 2 n=1 Tax=Pyrus ussuriensis x Pyrus communis TaxID=2448454 RepID=A0A5N5I0I2_9ROSA|nr:transcription initiation factor TFIID subunit 2 [Pyrus ussuriensis x Pyrus communis]